MNLLKSVRVVPLALAVMLVSWGGNALADPTEFGLESDEPISFEVEDTYLSYTDEGSGVTFTATTDSASPKTLLGVADPVSLEPSVVELEFHGGGLAAEMVTLTGLLPSTDYHLYRDHYDNHEMVTSDASGAVTLLQDADAEHVVTLQAEPSTVYIRASGGACNSWGTWDPGSLTCYITAPVVPDTITITDSGITLDCQHNSVDATGLNNGVYVRPLLTDVTVRNCDVSGSLRGIYSRSADSMITGNTIHDVVYQGIYLYTAPGSEVSGNTISNPGRDGVLVNVDSDGAVVKSNTVTYPGTYGIRVNRSVGVMVGGLLETDKNTVTGSGSLGIYVVNSSSADVFNNDIFDSRNTSMYFRNSPNGETQGNDVVNGIRGLYLRESDGHISTGDSFSTNSNYDPDNWDPTSLSIVGTSNAMVTNFTGNETLGASHHWCSWGVYMGSLGELTPANNNTVRDSQFYGNCVGMSTIQSSDGNTYDNVTVVGDEEEMVIAMPGNDVPGIYLSTAATNNTFKNSSVTTPGNAIELVGLEGTGNKFFSNTLTYGAGAMVNRDHPDYGYYATTTPVLLDNGAGVGNTWLSNGQGYSEQCLDTDADGVCDDPFVTDALNNSTDNWPVAVNPSVGDTDVDVSGDGTLRAYATVNEDGTTTVSMEETDTNQLNTFTVTFPEGTVAQAGLTDIEMVTTGGNRPGVVVHADLPAGTTKDVTLSRGVSRLICIDDRSDADFSTSPGGCDGDRFDLPADGACQTVSVNGDPTDPVHDVNLCVSADSLTVSLLGGLLHTSIYLLGDEDGDGWTDEMDLCPGTDLSGPVPTQTLRPGHMGDDETILGCNTSQILECKPGQDNGPTKFGLSPGLQDVFYEGIGWAWDCRPDLSLPACATNGDMDGDGVPDAEDSDERDTSTSSSDGDDDGLPDCQVL